MGYKPGALWCFDYQDGVTPNSGIIEIYKNGIGFQICINIQIWNWLSYITLKENPKSGLKLFNKKYKHNLRSDSSLLKIPWRSGRGEYILNYQ